MSAGALDIVRRFSKALREKRFDEVRGLLHEDLVVHEAGGLPYSGEYRGPQGFFDLLAAMNEVLELGPGPLLQESLGDHTVVSRFRLKFTARGSGRAVEMNLVEIYKVSDGLIAELDVYYKDPSVVTALLAVSQDR